MNTPNTPVISLAVCSWSLQPLDPKDLLTRVKATGIHRVQLALDPLRESPETWAATSDLLHEAGMTIVSGMCNCVGEDYSTLDTIRTTGGVVPDATWDQNLANMKAAAALASRLGLDLVTFHAGFLPNDSSTPDYERIQGRLGRLADLFADHGIVLALETGQETAASLRQFLKDLDRPNVGVNFDPANMILYGKGDPIEAITILGPLIRQTHIKDARRTNTPGTWGQEVVVGHGDVHWPRFFAALRKIKFAGNACIEREAGCERQEDILVARDYVQQFIG